MVREQAQSLVLCRVTQMSLLRLLSNPAVMGSEVVQRSGAWHVVDELGADSRVAWADEPLISSPSGVRCLPARAAATSWTDDYLAAFAQAGDLVPATLDGGYAKRYPSVRVEPLR